MKAACQTQFTRWDRHLAEKSVFTPPTQREVRRGGIDCCGPNWTHVKLQEIKPQTPSAVFIIGWPFLCVLCCNFDVLSHNRAAAILWRCCQWNRRQRGLCFMSSSDDVTQTCLLFCLDFVFHPTWCVPFLKDSPSRLAFSLMLFKMFYVLLHCVPLSIKVSISMTAQLSCNQSWGTKSHAIHISPHLACLITVFCHQTNNGENVFTRVIVYL